MKAYKDYTAEEKAEYKAKRDAYNAKRADNARASFATLEAELKKLGMTPTIEAALMEVKRSLHLEKGVVNRETYLTALFGTETPKPNTTVSYNYIGIRGPKGERMNPNETVKDFVTRTGDIVYKYDATTIGQMVWYVKRRGFEVEIDKEARTVTFVK
jgi:hypothetical protein